MRRRSETDLRQLLFPRKLDARITISGLLLGRRGRRPHDGPSASLGGTATRLDFDRDVLGRLEEAEEPDYAAEPWWCVRTSSFPCPAVGCDFVANFLTAGHLIVVWPSKDDRMLLHHAGLAMSYGRDPRVEEWRPEFGRCIAFDLYEHIGRPIHGRNERPEGWPT